MATRSPRTTRGCPTGSGGLREVAEFVSLKRRIGRLVDPTEMARNFLGKRWFKEQETQEGD